MDSEIGACGSGVNIPNAIASRPAKIQAVHRYKVLFTAPHDHDLCETKKVAPE